MQPAPAFVRRASAPRSWEGFKKFGLLVGLMSCLMFIGSAHATMAATCTFNNAGGDNLYSNASNWGGGIPCGRTPLATDAANVPAGQTAIMDSDATVTNAIVGGNLDMGTYSLTTTASLSSFALSAGGYVTSTSGALHAQGVATIAGTASTTNGSFLFDDTLTINSGGIWDIGSGSATSTGTLTDSGTIDFYGAAGSVAGTGTLSLGANFAAAGAFNKGAGTVRVTSASAQSIPCINYYNLVSLKTGNATTTITMSLTPTTATVSNGFTLSGTDGFAVAGTCSLTITLAWSIPSGSMFDIADRTVTSTGALTVAGTLNGGSGTLNLNDNFTNSGTFNAQTGTVRVYGTAAQSLAGVLYNDFTSLKTAETATFAASSTVLGALNMSTSGGKLSSAANALTVVGTTTAVSGTTVTSTSGTLTFTGVASSAGSIGSSAGNMFFGSTVQNNGTLDVGAGTATTTGVLTNFGVVNGNGGVLSIIDNLGSASGVFNAQQGTLRAYRDGGGLVIVYLAPGTMVNNFAIAGSATLAQFSSSSTALGTFTMSGSNAKLYQESIDFTVVGASTILSGNVATSSGAVLRFLGAVSSTGSIGSSTGNTFFGDTFYNNGTLDIGAGTATTTGVLTNIGTIYGRAGTLDLISNFVHSGTFTAGTGLVRLMGTAAQTIAGVLYNNLTSLKTSGTATLAASSTVLGTLNLNGNGGKLSAGSSTLTTVGAATVLSGATVTSTSGALVFTGAVSSTGLLGSSSGNMLFSSTLQNNGTFDLGSGNATTTDIATSTGIFYGRSGTLRIVSDFINSGTFTAGTGTVEAKGGTAHTLPGVSYYNLTIDKTDGIATSFAGSPTTTGAFTLTSGVLNVDTSMFYVPGTYTNTGGYVAITSGNIIHPIGTFAFTNSGGTTVTTYNTGNTMYIRAVDPNRNTSATTTQSFTVTVTAAGGGADSETVTLTETDVASGIFVGSIGLSYAASPTLGNGTMQISGSTTGNTSYTDVLDSSDTASASASLVYTAVNTGGGGGGGGGGLLPVTPVFMTTAFDQALLDNLKKMNIPLHSLVKLPNDGDVLTQEDSAVYYVAVDGKRHAFPNLATFSTWYSNFDGVQVITAAQLASMPLGASVTYKPGVKMVKFTTDPRVYAVSKGGILRWIKTEAAAVELYGPSWNKNVDDINDAFFSNYKFGMEIYGIGDFNPVNVKASVQFPSDSLQF